MTLTRSTRSWTLNIYNVVYTIVYILSRISSNLETVNGRLIVIGTNLAPAVRLVCWRQVNSPYLSGKTRLQTSFVGEMIDHPQKFGREMIDHRQQFGGEVIALLTNCYLSHWVEHACVWISSFDCGIILKYYCENHAHVVVFLPN